MRKIVHKRQGLANFYHEFHNTKRFTREIRNDIINTYVYINVKKQKIQDKTRSI